MCPRAPAVSWGAVSTLNVTPTACELPAIGLPLLSTAASEIEPIYDPRGSAVDVAVAADVAVTVNVALSPLASVAGKEGATASQPVPVVTVGVTVTAPLQFPITPTVKVFAAAGL